MTGDFRLYIWIRKEDSTWKEDYKMEERENKNEN